MIDKKDLTPEMFSEVVAKLHEERHYYKDEVDEITYLSDVYRAIKDALKNNATPEQIIDSMPGAREFKLGEAEEMEKVIDDIKEIREKIKAYFGSAKVKVGDNILLKSALQHFGGHTHIRSVSETRITTKLWQEWIMEKNKISTLDELEESMRSVCKWLYSAADRYEEWHHKIEQELQNMNPPENTEEN